MTDIKVEKDGKEWIATDGKYRATASTKREALARIQRRHDMAALDIPELAAIQRRWALSIEAIIPSLDPTDPQTMMQLTLLKSSIEGFDRMARCDALQIEDDIKELRERATAVKEIAP